MSEELAAALWVMGAGLIGSLIGGALHVLYLWRKDRNDGR